MNYWICIVSSSLSHKKLVENIGFNFCMPTNSIIGDKVCLYATKRACKSPGVFGIYTIANVDPSRDGECRSYGTITKKSDCPKYVELQKVTLPKKPVTIDLLKSNPTLSTSNFIKKNMLGTYFQLSKKEFEELEVLIKNSIS